MTYVCYCIEPYGTWYTDDAPLATPICPACGEPMERCVWCDG